VRPTSCTKATLMTVSDLGINICFIFGALVACSDSARPGAGLIVTARASAPALEFGETLRVHLQVRNSGNRPDSIVTPGVDCPILWRVDGTEPASGGPNGAFAADGTRCKAWPTVRYLAPGQAIGITYMWTGQRGNLGLPQDLPVGRYTIRAATQPAADIDRKISSRPVDVLLRPDRQ
jgi:hypothetical protein